MRLVGVLGVTLCVSVARAVDDERQAEVEKEEGCKGKVLLGVWTSKRTRERRRLVQETWFVKGCVVWLSCCPLTESDGVDPSDVVVTGGPDTYVGVTYRGVVGLDKMRERYDAPWYGVLGDDNYVHWPSLIAGLARYNSSAPIVGGERVAVGRGVQKPQYRFMGGAGIFHNARFADAIHPFIEAYAQQSLKSTEVHDLFFSRLVREKAQAVFGPGVQPADALTHMDFVFSTEPCVYVCGHSKAQSAVWGDHPPAVFHRFRTLEHMRRIHAVALSGRAPGDRRLSGVMKRTRFIQHLQCTIGQISDALCAAWHNCDRKSGPDSRLASPAAFSSVHSPNKAVNLVAP